MIPRRLLAGGQAGGGTSSLLRGLHFRDGPSLAPPARKEDHRRLTTTSNGALPAAVFLLVVGCFSDRQAETFPTDCQLCLSCVSRVGKIGRSLSSAGVQSSQQPAQTTIVRNGSPSLEPLVYICFQYWYCEVSRMQSRHFEQSP